MLRLSEKTQNTFSHGLEMTFGGNVASQVSYIIAANDHAGITDRFSLSAKLPTPEAANAPALPFANFG
tara:strand:- start:11 stop:214 length:204 start_codon:yes stop_codon:yes gene_type:complete